ncbi:unnamed protein product [Prorocentrum cordatum]|uniref:Anaphase-promoting complex subunit 1 n=1 Tax=Prorocentrum cordatum TaxID=2364126 RepID=A0ABN9SU84_9DINO|nr:unnamed protein product [Polarella glacialis]
MDVNLGKGGADYGHFLGELYDLGAIEVCESPQEVCGLFFVPRKDGRLRLIWGTRRSNAHFEVPPFTALPSGEALAALEIDETIAGQRIVAPSADVEVCFYQCELPSNLRPFFALKFVDLRLLLRRVRDQVSQQATNGHIQFQSRVVPMGWAWAVHLVQQAHMSLLKDVRPLDSWVLDKVPTEPISASHLAKILYIDNFASIGPTRARPDAATADVIASLADAGVKADMDPNSGTFGVHDLLGFSLVEHRATWALSARKFWKVKGALDYMVSSSQGFTGAEMERLLGHLGSCFLLRREMLSLLYASCTFAQGAKLHRAPLWPSVRKELRWCRALLPLVTADMSRPWSPLITSYDASPWGYGVCETSVSASQSGQIGRLNDRSRWKGLLATNRRPLDDLTDVDDVDDDFKIPRDRDTILSAGAVSGFTEVDLGLLRDAAWVTVAARPSSGALVAAGDPAGSSAATQPQSDVPRAWPRASASSNGITWNCSAFYIANRIREATQQAYLGILEQLAFFIQCRELPRFSAKVWDATLVDLIESRHDEGHSREATVNILYALLWALQAACAIAAKLLGYGQERAALGCLVMFETYCRVGELLALRMFQIAPPDRHSAGAAGCPTIVLTASELQALRPGNWFRLFLELFAGSGELTASMRRKGAAVLAFDVNQGPHMDLLNDDLGVGLLVLGYHVP